MNKEQVLIQLKDLLFNLENFEEVETTEEDVQALKYAINELERTAPEVPVQEQCRKHIVAVILSVIGIVLSIIGLLF